VVVTNLLDPHLDWRTFQLGAFGFGSYRFAIPAGLDVFQQRLDLTADLGLLVDFRASLNRATGLATWQFISLDTRTGLLPEDPFAGFLPPNVTNHIGEGFVSYYVTARANTASGDVVNALAEIVFDVNTPIATSNVFNTLDWTLPASQVEPLPAVSPPQFLVRWGGQDNAGILGYDIYAAKDRGPFTNWLAGVTNTSAVFTGDRGGTYAFYCVAVDAVGQREAPPSQADAWTSIPLLPPVFAAVGLSESAINLQVGNLAPGFRYVVERSATLRSGDWHRALDYEASAGTMLLAVPLQPDWRMMFFRVRLAQ
jgi:hypothetical protein